MSDSNVQFYFGILHTCTLTGQDEPENKSVTSKFSIIGFSIVLSLLIVTFTVVVLICACCGICKFPVRSSPQPRTRTQGIEVQPRSHSSSTYRQNDFESPPKREIIKQVSVDSAFQRAAHSASDLASPHRYSAPPAVHTLFTLYNISASGSLPRPEQPPTVRGYPSFERRSTVTLASRAVVTGQPSQAHPNITTIRRVHSSIGRNINSVIQSTSKDISVQGSRTPATLPNNQQATSGATCIIESAPTARKMQHTYVNINPPTTPPHRLLQQRATASPSSIKSPKESSLQRSFQLPLSFSSEKSPTASHNPLLAITSHTAPSSSAPVKEPVTPGTNSVHDNEPPVLFRSSLAANESTLNSPLEKHSTTRHSTRKHTQTHSESQVSLEHNVIISTVV